MTENALDLEAIARKHVPCDHLFGPKCHRCCEDYPCEKARLIARVRELEANISTDCVAAPGQCVSSKGTFDSHMIVTEGEARWECWRCGLFLEEAVLAALDAARARVRELEAAQTWEYGVTEPLDGGHVYAHPIEFCRQRIETRQELVRQSGADPSSVPVLMRRRKPAPGPWEPVLETKEDK